MLALGLDPGSSGAIVLADGGETGPVRAVSGASWSYLRDSGRWRYDWSGTEHPSRRLGYSRSLAGAVAGAARRIGLSDVEVAVLAWETAYVGPNPATAIALAHNRGAAVAALELSSWPGLVVPGRGIPNGSWWAACGLDRRITDRDARKAEAIRSVPSVLPGLAELLDALHGREHVADAGGVVYAALRHGAHRGTAKELESRMADALVGASGRRRSKRSRGR